MSGFEQTGGKMPDVREQRSQAGEEPNALDESLRRFQQELQQPKSNDAPADQAKPEEPDKRQLKTGDVVQFRGDNEFLTMPDGAKMAILNDLVNPLGLPVPLNERLVMQDSEGKSVGIKYVGTLTSIPPVDEYRFTNGARASVVSGIAAITFPNDDRMVVDELGLVAIKRRDKEDQLRDAVNLQPTIEQMTVPKPKAREV